MGAGPYGRSLNSAETAAGTVTGNSTVPAEFITMYADANGVVWNNPTPQGKKVDMPTFWYGLMNSFFLYSTMDLLDLDIRHTMLRKSVAAWTAAVTLMGGDFNHTGFNFSNMAVVDNGRWAEGDAAAGIALTGIWGAENAQRSAEKAEATLAAAAAGRDAGGGGGNITAAAVAAAKAALLSARQDAADGRALAKTALDYLERQTVSPLYECVMPQGALAAARMNAMLNASTYNVSKMLEFTFADGHNQFRQGWGMLGSGTQWGGRDVGGTIGSITDGGGYAFAGNGLWNMAALIPIPRYQPQYTRIIAKWSYNILSNAKYFNPDTPAVAGKQSNPDDKWDRHNVVMYEGLRKCDFDRSVQSCRHGEAFGPFATGDWCELVNCTNVADKVCKRVGEVPCSDRSDRVLYGGGAVGVFGAVAAATNESSVLQLDVLATDVYAEHFAPTYIYYNPSTTRTVWVQVSSPTCVPDKSYDVYDVVSETMLATGIDCSVAGGGEGIARATAKIAPDTAMLLEIRLLTTR